MQDKPESISVAQWMCNFAENIDQTNFPDHISQLWKCDWFALLKHPISTHILTRDGNFTDVWDDQVQTLAIAIAALQAFVQENFIGPRLDECKYSELPFYTRLQSDKPIDFAQLISVDGEEVNVNVLRPELLLIAKTILEHQLADSAEIVDAHIVQWWYLRYLYVHQQVMDEATDTLYSGFLSSTEKLLGWEQADVETKTLLRLEIIQGLLAYRRTWKAVEHLDAAKQLMLANIEVTAFLGKRTKWQQKALPQMALRITLDHSEELPSAIETHPSTDLPTLLQLDDDVRLEKITFELDEDNRTLALASLVQQLVLSILQYTLRSQPKDNLADEEITPYLTTLLYQPHGGWATRITTLLLNIAQESNHKRTVERSLKQCEEVVNLLDGREDATVFQRLSYIHSSYIRPRWHIQAELGALMVSLGMIKTALDLYLQLRKWSEVITCYTVLELRHKAADVIQQQLAHKPTVELYCLLGDATDDVQYYAQAWALSNQRSGRAQRHWGCYFFAKHDYAAAIPHLQRSLELNSLQDTVWARLGYSAIMLEDWKLAAEAYRRYTSIEPNGFECWNNLSKAYINLGDKPRAHKVLHEALKCNFSNWKVWENFLLVSIDTGNFEDAINAFNQLIELRGKYFDEQVLQIIAKSVANDVPDAEGNSTKRLVKKTQKLVGHLGVLYPNEALVWEMAALLHNEEPLANAQNLQKAYRCKTQTQTQWSKNPTTCLEVLQLCDRLCQTSIDAWRTRSDSNQAACASQLSSARMSAQGCMRAATAENWDECADAVQPIESHAAVIRELLLKR